MNFVVRDCMENTSVAVKCRKWAVKDSFKLTYMKVVLFLVLAILYVEDVVTLNYIHVH